MSVILKATHRDSARSAAAAHEGIATVEVQDPRVGTIHGTRPIEAAGANVAERTIAEDAGAGNGQFKR